MDIRQIEGFFWVATLGSVSAAAKRLFITQSAMSSRILALEKELGEAIFDRGGTGLTLTRRGMGLLENARAVLDLVAQMRDSTTVGPKLRGTVRLGIVNTIAHTVLPRLIMVLEERYPELDVDVRVGVSNGIEDLLNKRDIDLGVLVSPARDRAIKSEFMCRYQLNWAASPEFPVSRKLLSLRELAEYRILTYERGTSVYGIVNELFQSHGIWPIRLTSSNSVAAILDLAQSGVGICVVPGPVAKPFVGTGRLKFLRCEIPLPKVDFYVAHTTQPYNEMGAAIAGIIVNLAKASRGPS